MMSAIVISCGIAQIGDVYPIYVGPHTHTKYEPDTLHVHRHSNGSKTLLLRVQPLFKCGPSL